MMHKVMQLAVLAAAASGLAGCTTVGGPGVSRYYDCRDGLILKVTPTKKGVIVQSGSRRIAALRTVSAIRGEAYEGGGYRLAIMGNRASWNGPTKQAAKTCAPMAVPR